jgi:hypothetical protein
MTRLFVRRARQAVALLLSIFILELGIVHQAEALAIKIILPTDRGFFHISHRVFVINRESEDQFALHSRNSIQHSFFTPKKFRYTAFDYHRDFMPITRFYEGGNCLRTVDLRWPKYVTISACAGHIWCNLYNLAFAASDVSKRKRKLSSFGRGVGKAQNYSPNFDSRPVGSYKLFSSQFNAFSGHLALRVSRAPERCSEYANDNCRYGSKRPAIEIYGPKNISDNPEVDAIGCLILAGSLGGLLAFCNIEREKSKAGSRIQNRKIKNYDYKKKT